MGKVFRIVAGLGCLAMLVALAFVGSVSLKKTEELSYEDRGSCRTDNLFAIKEAMSDYMEDYAGQLPATTAEAVAFFKEYYTGHDYFRCQAADAPFVWRPPEVQTAAGWPVRVMCPPESHGSWKRRFAWGVIEGEQGLEFVRVFADGRAIRENSPALEDGGI